MAAVVDVVRGAPVRERMKKTQRLEELQLWGQYQGVSIFLEWETSNSRLRRFVVFVCHPEAMIYADPTTLGKKQDLHLQEAAKLAKMHIPDKFYEEIYQRGSHKFLSGAEHARRAALNEEALRTGPDHPPESIGKDVIVFRILNARSCASILDCVGIWTRQTKKNL
ncbi:hypothetical protein MAJ_08837, partial [Metarhizium majus ARSEF 297]